MYILKLNPVFKDYLWGGTKLRDEYGFKSNLSKLAEGWMLSCHKDGENTVENGEFIGKTLTEVINANPDYLGENGKNYEIHKTVWFEVWKHIEPPLSNFSELHNVVVNYNHII